MELADLIFTLGSIIFALALVPSIRGLDKPDIKTSLTTGSVLAVFAATYLSIEFWFSASMTLVTSLMWFTLAWQKRQGALLDEAFAEGWGA
jgi:hypothetical protein